MDENLGKVFLNRFRIDEPYTSEVAFSCYRGFDLKRNLALSIKVFNYPIQPDPTVLCFQQNHLTIQTVVHPNIVPFYGLFEEGTKSFFVERFIDGFNLNEIFKQLAAKPMPSLDALVYLKSITTALEYLHGFGLVHATVAPETIQAARDGSILLSNYGFARSTDQPMTETGLYGLPLCLAPEQLRGEKISPATDIYALGIILYEMITGVHPFLQAPSCAAQNDQGTATNLRQAHLTQPPPDPRQFVSNLPGGLSQSLLTALEKDPKDRYQSPQEMLEICCAVFSVNPEQVPDRLSIRSAAATQAVDPIKNIGAIPFPEAYQAGTKRDTFAAPYMTPDYRQGADSGQSGTQVVPSELAGGTQVVPMQPLQGTQVVSQQPWVGGSESTFPASTDLPYGDYLVEKPARPKWLIPVIGGIVVILGVCGLIGIWAGFPYIKEMLATATSTPTATQSPTPTFILIPPTPMIIPTVPVLLPPTEPPLAPTIELPPTALPTEISSPTPTRSAFKVTIRNSLRESIFAFRDNTLMGTDPIPPGKYIYYLNIPAGPHYFVFCYMMNMSQCPVEQQVIVDGDITITVR